MDVCSDPDTGEDWCWAIWGWIISILLSIVVVIVLFKITDKCAKLCCVVFLAVLMIFMTVFIILTLTYMYEEPQGVLAIAKSYLLPT